MRFRVATMWLASVGSTGACFLEAQTADPGYVPACQLSSQNELRRLRSQAELIVFDPSPASWFTMNVGAEVRGVGYYSRGDGLLWRGFTYHCVYKVRPAQVVVAVQPDTVYR